ENHPNSPPSLLTLTKVPRIGSFCYRDGKLWLEQRFDALGGRGRARFTGVDLKNFATESADFDNEDYSLPALMQRRAGSRPFEVDPHYLYVALTDSVRRYSFRERVWEPLPQAGAGKPVRLNDRLFFTSPTSILESSGNDTIKVLASSRRHPAVSVLDN